MVGLFSSPKTMRHRLKVKKDTKTMVKKMFSFEQKEGFE